MVKKIKNKKGSHVGVVLSFGIFVTFLIFLYIAIEPALQTKQEQTLLINKLRPQIIDKVSTNFTTMTISNSSADDCIRIGDYEYADMNSTIVLDPQGDVISSNVSDGDLYIESSLEEFYKIHSADVQLDTQSFDTSTCGTTASSYERGINRKQNEISEQKTLDLIDEYDYNYSNIKKEFNVPDTKNFGIDFIHSNGTLVKANATNFTRDIFIKDFSIQYFDGNAEKKGGFLRIRIW